MNKKLVKLTESDLHKIVKESVNKVLNEIADETLRLAWIKSKKKVKDYARKYGANSPATDAATEQSNYFGNEISKRYNEAPLRKKGRMQKNFHDMDSGDRKYVKGLGWKTERY